jgi:hypothetical protein
MMKSMGELEADRLAMASIQAEQKRAHTQAVRDARRAGRDPGTDIVVQMTRRNLDTAIAQYQDAERAHRDALLVAAK